MENASKALLIAAAVLIVILLIAFGMRIFNTASSAGDATETSNQLAGGISAGTISINSALQSGLQADGSNPNP